MENLYDGVLYDELPYDDTDSIDYNLDLPGYQYGRHFYGAELYGDPDDYDLAATAAGNSVSLAATHIATASGNKASLAATHTATASGNTVALASTIILTASGNTVALKSIVTRSITPNTVALKTVDKTVSNSGNTVALKAVNIVVSATANKVALTVLNRIASVSGNTVALKATVPVLTILNTVALKNVDRTTSNSGNTVYLQALGVVRSIGVTAHLQKLNNQRIIGATVSLLSLLVPNTVRAKGNTVALKGYTVLTEIPQPVGAIVEAQSLATSIVEGLSAVTGLEATNAFTTTLTESDTNLALTSVIEIDANAHEALYDTQLYDVPMYDETEAVLLAEQVTATCGIAALGAPIATLTERDTWTLSSIVSGTTFISFMYGVMMYGEALYGETKTDIIDTSIVEAQRPIATIGSV